MIVTLYQPEIPQNTGTIGRLCVATQTKLYLVRPLGFFLDSKEIERSGLDYWGDLDYALVDNLDEITQEHPQSRVWYLSTKGKIPYTGVAYQKNDILVFGNEGHGLPESILNENNDHVLTVPMWGPTRSLNLATTVGVVLYESYRQLRR